MKKRLIFIILAIIAWCMVIFAFSAMNNNESNSKSKKTIDTAVEKTLQITNESGITNKHPSKEKMKKFVEFLNEPLRKCMHASVYFVLSILLFSFMKIANLKGKKIYFIPIILCFIYACTDEYHQLFVDGRTGQFTDVLIDTLGATIGIVWVALISKMFTHKKVL